VPSEFGALVALEQLDLSQNRLRSLPLSCAQLVRLEWLKLEGNLQLDIPVVVINQGPQAVVQYLKYVPTAPAVCFVFLR
jgi:hypothetical protein